MAAGCTRVSPCLNSSRFTIDHASHRGDGSAAPAGAIPDGQPLSSYSAESITDDYRAKTTPHACCACLWRETRGWQPLGGGEDSVRRVLLRLRPFHPRHLGGGQALCHERSCENVLDTHKRAGSRVGAWMCGRARERTSDWYCRTATRGV